MIGLFFVDIVVMGVYVFYDIVVVDFCVCKIEFEIIEILFKFKVGYDSCYYFGCC